MKFEWPRIAVLALSAISIFGFWIGHRWLLAFQMIGVIVIISFLALLFVERRKNPDRRIADFWILPCVLTGLWFFHEWRERHDGMMTVLTAIVLALNLFALVGNWRLGSRVVQTD